jgi:polysaccharide biosynthesis protein PslA
MWIEGAPMKDEPSLAVSFRGCDETGGGSVATVESIIARPGRKAHGARCSLSAGKRAFDLVGSVLLLVLLLPGLLLIALAIKLTSRGPVLFRQPRHGLHGRPFGIYKFRTMFADRADPSGVDQTRRADPRVTPLGRFLRKSNLDEVPQLINVILGEMSLVGPRPHVPGMRAGGMLYEQLVPYYHERHKVRPGITGLAQVRGLRGGTDDPALAIARIGHDLQYIERWSLALDCRILIETVWTELITGGNGV